MIFSQNCSDRSNACVTLDPVAHVKSSLTLQAHIAYISGGSKAKNADTAAIFDMEMDFLINQTAEIYGISNAKKICVAVSGGSDSMSLLMLAHSWARKRNFSISCVTVDHKLRPESASEALFVRDFCQSIGVDHCILEWNQRDVGSNASLPSETYASIRRDIDHGELENLAREARYGLIENFCKKSDIKLLLTGHTLNDQLETFEMRKQCGSSEFGLAGMSRIRSISDELKLLRPILRFTKKQLENFLIGRNMQWKNDPMNEDVSFRRVFYRKQIMSYDDEKFFGCVNEMLRLREMRNKIEKSAVALLKNQEICVFSDLGYATLNLNALLAETTEVQREIIKRIVWNIGGKKYANNITEETIEKILAKKSNTIGRCLIKIKKNTMHVFRENRNFERVLWDPSSSNSCIFDNRFLISRHQDERTDVGIHKNNTDSSTLQIVPAYHEAEKKTHVRHAPLGLPCISKNNTIVFVHGIFCDSQMKEIGISCRFLHKVNLFDVFL
ncbi:hypothetical protein FACS189449_05790 [Alphaproteobacteria bacterium]|nr:hypothetical protein FACS189449_05790 [Alphaproteobacteria bacterium]